MKTIKTLLLAGLMSFLPVKNVQAQDQVQIKGNQCLEWIADGIGNQNGILEPFEEKYMREEFKKLDILYVCTQLSDEFGPKMMKLYNTLEGAANHKREDLLRWPPQSILSFNKEGRIIGAYSVAEGMVRFDVIPNINCGKRMSERYERFYERR